jgi:hypothetical protein
MLGLNMLPAVFFSVLLTTAFPNRLSFGLLLLSIFPNKLVTLAIEALAKGLKTGFTSRAVVFTPLSLLLGLLS